jgi:hypothetical protein
MSGILGALLASYAPAAAGDYESIATVTVGSSGAANVEFTSIPSTFSHLQIRYIVRNDFTSGASNFLEGQFNSDTGNNYAAHWLFGNGSTVTAGASSSRSTIRSGIVTSTYSGSSSAFSVGVIDILDYANTSKYKTVRALGGYDSNNVSAEPGYASFISSLWQNTNAITSIKLFNGNTSFNLVQYSHFALYGIKSA